MIKEQVAHAPFDDLRRCAEQRLAQRGESAAEINSDLLKLVHELQVQQVELEVQNESLLAAQAQIENGQRFTDLYEFAPVGYFSIDAVSSIRLLNQAGASLLGLPSSQLKGRCLKDYVAAESQPAFDDFIASMFDQNCRVSCEICLCPEGAISPIAVHIEAVCDVQRRVGNLAITDITAHKRAEDAIHEQKEFFRLIAENIDGFIAVLDREGRRIYNSPSYAELLGQQDLTGTVSFADVHPVDQERVEQAFRETVETGVGKHLEYHFIMNDGRVRLMDSHGGAVFDIEGRVKYVVVVTHDITERQEAEEKVRRLAFYDPLTHLPNRLTLNDRLQHAMAASKRSGRYGALLFLDLDNFKPVNDTYGHEAGDLLLVQAAERIAKCVREIDTVARFGGDEFVVMLGELDVDRPSSMGQAELVAEKIRAAIADPYFLEIKTCDGSLQRIEHHCTVSIGATLFLDHECSEEEVIKQADSAMYCAKEAGRDRVLYAGGR